MASRAPDASPRPLRTRSLETAHSMSVVSSASAPQPLTAQPLMVIVLAAGKGTRMRSDRPKVLHKVAGWPMVLHVLAAADRLQPAARAVVVGPGMEDVAATVADWPVAVQARQAGTADAVAAAEALWRGFAGTVLVVYGDTPLITAETLARLASAVGPGEAPAVAVLGFRPADPAGYGRLLRDADGRLERIVEAADADAAARSLDLCNAGLMAIDGAALAPILAAIGNDNAKGEYYLTDAVALARRMGRGAVVVEGAAEELMGINSRAELAAAEAAMQARLRARAMAGGATLVDPAAVYLAADTALGRDVEIGPQVVFGPGVVVEDGAIVQPFCHLEGVVVGAGATVGPFARLRPGSRLGPGAHVGNFVEIKNTALGAGAKASHLSYLGDAEIGEAANIGAGTITCNYDGFLKHTTVIGDRAFIGSNSALVAPVRIGRNANIGAGSVITRDVADDALAVARGRQIQRAGWALTYRAMKAAEKAAR